MSLTVLEVIRFIKIDVETPFHDVLVEELNMKNVREKKLKQTKRKAETNSKLLG